MKTKASAWAKFICMAACLINSATAFAEGNLLISDIDDTIKRTHVRGPLDLVFEGRKTDIPFIGMKELYEKFLAADKACFFAGQMDAIGYPSDCIDRENNSDENNRNAIIYLSASPKEEFFIIKPLSYGIKFLLQTKFPMNPPEPKIYRKCLPENSPPESSLGIIGRDSNTVDMTAFKTNKIDCLTEQFKESQILLIGDNGQSDAKAFIDAREILESKGYSMGKIHRFIHHV